MSVKTEIERLAANIAGAYAACGEKGAALPVLQTSDFLPEAIRSIQGGGGGDICILDNWDSGICAYIGFIRAANFNQIVPADTGIAILEGYE